MTNPPSWKTARTVTRAIIHKEHRDLSQTPTGSSWIGASATLQIHESDGLGDEFDSRFGQTRQTWPYEETNVLKVRAGWWGPDDGKADRTAQAGA